MKRFSIVAILLCALTLSIFAATKPVAFQNVPELVQQAVLANFQQDQIQFITSKKEYRNYEYEFVLKDGTTLKYDAKAKFRRVKNKNGVKEVFLPENILQYVRQTFPNTVVTDYKKESYRQKVKLDDQMGLVFDKRGKFMHIDF